MPRRARPLSIFMGLPQMTREVLRSQPLATDAVPDDEGDEPSPSDLLPTQPARPSSREPESPYSLVMEKEEVMATDSPAFTPLQAAASAPASAVLVSSSSGLPASPTLASTSASTTIIGTKRSISPSGSSPRRRKKTTSHAWDCTGLVPRYTDAKDVPARLKKYFYQRHSLFPAYSRLPLLLDETGWYSVTPAVIAKQIAERCRCDVILDAFCGVGGNAIAFARTCERVIAMDNDMTRLKIARHNALHYGVADRIEFVLCDYVQWAREYAPRAGGMEAIDVVFLSPPWGGPEYLSFGGKYPLKAVEPIPGDELFRLTERITPNIAYFLPRNVDIEEVGALASPLEETEEGREREWVEVEEEWVGEKLKAVTAYYGGLIQ